MANAYKILGQLELPITTPTAIYTVPGSTEAIIKAITITNTASAATVELWIGTASTDLQLILPPVSIGAGEFAVGTGSIALAAGDIIYGRAGTASTISVSLSGVEIT